MKSILKTLMILNLMHSSKFLMKLPRTIIEIPLFLQMKGNYHSIPNIYIKRRAKLNQINLNPRYIQIKSVIKTILNRLDHCNLKVLLISI